MVMVKFVGKGKDLMGYLTKLIEEQEKGVK